MKKKLKKQNREKSKLFATALVIFLCVVTVYWAKFARSSKQEMKKSLSSRTIGNPGADIRIIEYADFQCSTCAKGYLLLKDYLNKYPERLQIEFKYHPWTRKRHALDSALYAECSAKQGKFWEYTQLLFKRQKNWKHEVEAEMIFRKMAQEVGLDEHELAECVMSEQTKRRVLAEKEKGRSLGIRITPTYFINGKMVVGVENLKRELDIYFK